MVVGQVLGGLGGFDAAALAVVLLAFVLMAVLAAGAPLLRILRLRPSDALRSE
jgi:ABC-type antimicrobial peptide transport system permease subunit